MTQPYIGEVQAFGFNFNPRGWAFCNGAVLPISQNTALFSLIGIQYGGNGQTTFQLPNLSGRAACQQGQGPGLSDRALGQPFGLASVTLNANQIPAHNHGVAAWSQPDPAKRSGVPVVNGGLSFITDDTTARTYNGTVNITFAVNAIAPTSGGGSPHPNQQPYLGVNFCIALQGIYPSFP